MIRLQAAGRFRVVKGTVGEGKECTLYGVLHVGQDWAVVKFDDEDDPTTFKMGALEPAGVMTSGLPTGGTFTCSGCKDEHFLEGNAVLCEVCAKKRKNTLARVEKLPATWRRRACKVGKKSLAEKCAFTTCAEDLEDRLYQPVGRGM